MNTKEFALGLGVSEENVRDWRRRGFLVGVGHKEGRGYVYDQIDSDLVSAAIARWRELPSLGDCISFEKGLRQ